MMVQAEALKDALTGIDGISSVAIGIEPGISIADYPAIRIVPVREQPGGGLRTVSCVFDVFVVANRDQDYTTLHAALDGWAAQVRQRVLSAVSATWHDTTWDEDRLPAAKALVMRFELLSTF